MNGPNAGSSMPNAAPLLDGVAASAPPPSNSSKFPLSTPLSSTFPLCPLPFPNQEGSGRKVAAGRAGRQTVMGTPTNLLPGKWNQAGAYLSWGETGQVSRAPVGGVTSVCVPIASLVKDLSTCTLSAAS